VPVRVLVVDDMPEMRSLVRTTLRIRGGADVVGEADTTAAGAALASDLAPDVVVLDLRLPDSEDREGFCSIRRVAPESHIVIFSAYDVDRDWFESRGARFVAKEPDLGPLVRAVAECGPGR
jgi:DNA-binding NarL/FixJ family response regulator